MDNEHKKSYTAPTNEHDVKRTEIRCRDDVALERIRITSKFLGLLYAIVWAGAIVAVVAIFFSHATK